MLNRIIHAPGTLFRGFRKAADPIGHAVLKTAQLVGEFVASSRLTIGAVLIGCGSYLLSQPIESHPPSNISSIALGAASTVVGACISGTGIVREFLDNGWFINFL